MTFEDLGLNQSEQCSLNQILTVLIDDEFRQVSLLFILMSSATQRKNIEVFCMKNTEVFQKGVIKGCDKGCVIPEV